MKPSSFLVGRRVGDDGQGLPADTSLIGAAVDI
jgi:hypothetical protein